MTANEYMKSIKDNLNSVEHNLEQIQCDDCISREAAIYVASGFCHPSNVAKELAKLPPVTPKPKTGKWIQTNEFFINRDGQFIYKFICSECKSLSYFRKSNKKAIGAIVCPNCEARMVDPQESEEI